MAASPAKKHKTDIARTAHRGIGLEDSQWCGCCLDTPDVDPDPCYRTCVQQQELLNLKGSGRLVLCVYLADRPDKIEQARLKAMFQFLTLVNKTQRLVVVAVPGSLVWLPANPAERSQSLALKVGAVLKQYLWALAASRLCAPLQVYQLLAGLISCLQRGGRVFSVALAQDLEYFADDSLANKAFELFWERLDVDFVYGALPADRGRSHLYAALFGLASRGLLGLHRHFVEHNTRPRLGNARQRLESAEDQTTLIFSKKLLEYRTEVNTDEEDKDDADFPISEPRERSEFSVHNLIAFLKLHSFLDVRTIIIRDVHSRTDEVQELILQARRSCPQAQELCLADPDFAGDWGSGNLDLSTLLAQGIPRVLTHVRLELPKIVQIYWSVALPAGVQPPRLSLSKMGALKNIYLKPHGSEVKGQPLIFSFAEDVAAARQDSKKECSWRGNGIRIIQTNELPLPPVCIRVGAEKLAGTQSPLFGLEGLNTPQVSFEPDPGTREVQDFKASEVGVTWFGAHMRPISGPLAVRIVHTPDEAGHDSEVEWSDDPDL